MYFRFPTLPFAIPFATPDAGRHELGHEPVQHSDDYKIVIILDESGSMDTIRENMIKAINDLITEQQQIKDRPCRLTLVKFNDKVTRVIKNKKLEKIKQLTLEDYVPHTTTALFDAIGSTIDWFRYESNVLLVIVTDGQENASKKYTKQQITHMLDEKKKYRGWSCVYLSNDLSTATQGYGLGLDNSRECSNCVSRDLSTFISKDINTAIYNQRVNGISVQSQLQQLR